MCHHRFVHIFNNTKEPLSEHGDEGSLVKSYQLGFFLNISASVTARAYCIHFVLGVRHGDVAILTCEPASPYWEYSSLECLCWEYLRPPVHADRWLPIAVFLTFRHSCTGNYLPAKHGMQETISASVFIWANKRLKDKFLQSPGAYFRFSPGGPLQVTRQEQLVKNHDWDTRGTWFKSCLGAVFPAVLLPTVNWELVAKHKGHSQLG